MDFISSDVHCDSQWLAFSFRVNYNEVQLIVNWELDCLFSMCFFFFFLILELIFEMVFLKQVRDRKNSNKSIRSSMKYRVRCFFSKDWKLLKLFSFVSFFLSNRRKGKVINSEDWHDAHEILWIAQVNYCKFISELTTLRITEIVVISSTANCDMIWPGNSRV